MKSDEKKIYVDEKRKWENNLKRKEKRRAKKKGSKIIGGEFVDKRD